MAATPTDRSRRDTALLATLALAALGGAVAFAIAPGRAEPMASPGRASASAADAPRIERTAAAPNLALAEPFVRSSPTVEPVLGLVSVSRSIEPIGPPAVDAAPTHRVPRLPDLEGLLLEPGADAERFRAWYARRDDDALARARFRLERLLEAFEAEPAASPVVWLLSSDVDAVRAELAFVIERITALPIALDAVELALPCDDDAVFERRHARASAEDLHAAWSRTLCAHQALQTRYFEAHVAHREYEVVPESSLFA